ncbi:hypothetical protein Bca101_069247 [Brassica carinata]
MGDSSSFVDGIKGFWEERLSFLENYTRFTKRDTPLPSWSSSDVEEFIASDPLHGPTLKTAREAATFGVTGAALGAVSTAAFAWKYSRSPHGKEEVFSVGPLGKKSPTTPCNSISWTQWRLKLRSWNGGSASLNEGFESKITKTLAILQTA